MLHYWDDLTTEQIATTTGATVNAASVRLSRARKRFREAFAKFEES
jgi:DNA-directed RNA polymerase specialized sigma24 family protein